MQLILPVIPETESQKIRLHFFFLSIKYFNRNRGKYHYLSTKFQFFFFFLCGRIRAKHMTGLHSPPSLKVNMTILLSLSNITKVEASDKGICAHSTLTFCFVSLEVAGDNVTEKGGAQNSLYYHMKDSYLPTRNVYFVSLWEQ